MNFDFIKNIPNQLRLIILALGIVIIVGMFIAFIYIPKNNEMSQLSGDIAKLENEINIYTVKVRRLDELKRENAELERQLIEKKEQLPQEAEVAMLLKQISELGIRAGLDFKLWKPGQRTENSSGLYAEIPVSVEVAGGYHALGIFFDRVGKLPRIVNITSLRMGNAKIEKGQFSIQTSFIATAFAAAQPQPEKPSPGHGKTAPGGKGQTKPSSRGTD
jgi:type IV pilus assembly protein PilO